MLVMTIGWIHEWLDCLDSVNEKQQKMQDYTVYDRSVFSNLTHLYLQITIGMQAEGNMNCNLCNIKLAVVTITHIHNSLKI